MPDEIIEQYELKEKADDNGWVHVEIRKGMCGSKQAGRIAHDQLKERLAVHGCHPWSMETQIKTNPGVPFGHIVRQFMSQRNSTASRS